MNRLFWLLLPLLLILTGCSKHLSGRYETSVNMPTMQMSGMDPQYQAQMGALIKQTQDMNRLFLEFDGSTVKMGSPVVVNVYKYRIDGQRLEVIAEGMGQQAIIPMTIEADGSISYLGMRFIKVQ